MSSETTATTTPPNRPSGQVSAPLFNASLVNAQRLIQDNPTRDNIDRATELFMKSGFSGHFLESARGLLACAKQYSKPTLQGAESSFAHAQKALLHAANFITNPKFCHGMRDVYLEQGTPVRDSIAFELLRLAMRIQRQEKKYRNPNMSFALDCLEWTHLIARKKSGLREKAAYLYAKFTRDAKHAYGIDIRSLRDQSIAQSLESPAVRPVAKKLSSTHIDVGASAIEPVRAEAHHHRTDHGTSHPHPATVHASTGRLH